MQSVSSAWTAEEKDNVRSVGQGLLVSWKKDTNLANRTFTIGVSLIGGPDAIGINPAAVGGPGIYRYFDETEYAMALSWERGFNMPLGGLAKGLAEADLSNTSGRFTPRYMGGSSELYTAMLPRRPFIINGGFEFDGVPQTIPQFSGITTKTPQVDKRRSMARIQGSDYVDFFQNRYLDQEVMFTGKRTDEVINTLFQSLGMSTAQYELDYGINVIPFGLFEKGTRYADIMNQLAQAENAHIYQDEQGKFRFENRQHWDSAPYTEVQRIIRTSQVLEAESPTEDHIINVVEIEAPIVQKQPAQTIFSLPVLSTIQIPANDYVEQFFEFDDPVLALTDPSNGGSVSYYLANTASDGSGTDATSSVTFTNVGTFAKAVKYRIQNSSSSIVYITQLVLSGRVAKKVSDLYYRARDDSSVTAYEERPISINNPYIQNYSWANSYAQMILNDFSEPEKLQKITIRAIPELQIGDLVSWGGRYFRVYDIKAKLDPSNGYIQQLTMLQRTIVSYFRIGISTIGGLDRIAP